MSKRLLFALGLGIALTGFAPAASAQLVWQRVEWARGLAAGTSSTMVPFNHSGSFAYTYVETIYDNDSLVLASGTYIDTVWFYCTAVGDPVPNDASVEIRISTTPLSAHSTVKGWLTGSTAASATFATTLQPTTTGWFPIKLDTPFEYTGEDNLVITVYRNGSDGTGQTYAGITTAATRTTLGYGGASAWSATQPGNRGHAHRPDLRLSVRAPRVNKPVENLAAAGSTQTTATVDWSVNAMALEPVGYKIEYGPRGFTEGTGTKIITTDGTATSHTVEELAAATWYDVYVSAIAGPADTSASRKVSLATGCDKKSIPWAWTYTEGQLSDIIVWSASQWTGSNELPLCWDFPNKGANSTSYPQFGISTSGSTPTLTLVTDNEVQAVAVLPEMALPINQLLLSFHVSLDGLEYGYITDAADASTFRLLGTAYLGDNYVDYEEFGMEVPGGARIAFRYTSAESYVMPIYVSAISVEEAPACKRPGAITIDESALTSTSATFSWSGRLGAGNSYRLKVVKANQTDTVTLTGLTTQSYTLSTYNDAPLEVGTAYLVYVDKLCGGSYTPRMEKRVTTLGVIYASVESACTGMGTVYGNATGPLGRTSTFRAVPNNHYHFVEWNDGNTSNPRNIFYQSVASLSPYTATFAINTHTINFASNNESYGTVSNATGEYAYGSIVSSTATPNAGYYFAGWSDGTTSSTINHTVRADNTLTAYFVPDGSVLCMGTLRNSVAGYSITQTPADGIVSEGQTVSIEVTAPHETGYRNNWVTTPTTESHTTGTLVYQATYTAGSTSQILVFNNDLKSFVLGVTVNNPLFGEVVGSSNGSIMYFNEAVSAQAAPLAGYKFARWTGYAPGTDNPLTFNMPAANASVNAVFRRDSITVHLIGEEGGTVALTYQGTTTTGSEVIRNVATGDSYTITAAASNSHYTFFQWSDAVGTAERSLTATGNDGTTKTLTAMFSPEILNITATSNIGVCTASGSNTYAYNRKATLTATPETHYDFTRWTLSGSEVSTSATYAFTVLASGNYTAEFTPKSYTITAASESASRGSVSGGGSYVYNTTVTLTATPEPGWAFTQWSDGNTSNPRIFAAEADLDVTAQFEQEVYHLTLNVVNGIITDEATLEAADYHYGDVVTLTAVNADPVTYRWAGWSDGGAQSHTYTVTASATLTATFTAMDRYVVNASPNNDLYGSCATDAADYTSVQTAEVRATANTGYLFDHWTNIPAAYMYDNPLRIDMDEHDTLIQAIFVAIPYTVSTSVNNAAWGTLTGGGAYTYNSTALLTAIPMPGYRVDSWSTGTSRNLTQSSLTVTGNTTVSVNFCPDTFNISAMATHATITMTHEGDVVPGASGAFAYGSVLTLTAVPDANYSGNAWSDGNTNATRTITVGNEDKIYVYYTNADTYTITGISADPVMGYVTGSDTRAYGQQTTLVAHANPHYTFLQWNDGNTNASRIETFTSDRIDTAYFAIGQHTITLAGDDASLGAVSINGGASTGAFNYGSSITLLARPNAGVKFLQWVEDGITDTLRSYTVADDATLTATWDSIAYTLDTFSNSLVMGHINASPSKAYYRYGESVSLAAEINNSSLYRFVGWSDGETSTTHSTITFTDEEVVRISAIFEEKSRHAISVVPNNASWGSTTGCATNLTNGTYPITATPLHDYTEFLGWSDNGSTDSPRTIVINDNDFIATANFGLKSYTATSADLAGNGTVSGTGTFPYGTSLTLFATANPNYLFRGWSNGETQNPYTFTIVSDTAINPIFTLDSVDIAVVAPHTDAIIGAGRYAIGEAVTLRVTPSAHYHVSSWSLNGSIVATTTDTLPTFYATSSITLVVDIESDQYSLWIGNAQPTMGQVDGAQLNTLLKLDYGTNLTLSATPNAHYDFVGWITPSGDTVSHTATFAFNLTADTNLTAHFRPTTFAVSTVSADLTQGTTTGSDADSNYTYGSLFTAVATPATGYTFKQWTPGNITTNPYTFQVQTATTLTAEFEAAAYTLTATPNDPAMGSITLTPSRATYSHGDTVRIAVSYDPTRYRFISWSNGDTREAFDTIVTSHIALIAIFNDAFQKNVTLFANGNGTATASANSVYEGTTVTITATPADTNTYFAGWSNGITTAVTNITVTTDTLLTATFLPKQRALDVLIAGRGSVSHDLSYAHGTSLTLIATPDAHAHFLRWDNGSTALHRTITMDSSITLSALFANDSVRIQASAINGQVSVSDTLVSYDSTFYLTATAADHYSHFLGWTRNGIAISGSETILIDAQNSASYQATFAIDTVSLTLAVSDPSQGAIVGASSGNYPYGARIQMAATPARNHHFIGWASNPALTSANLDTTLTTNTTLTALFCLDSFNLVASTDATLHFGTATIDGNRTRFGYGEVATLRARPSGEMYRFVKWDDGNIDSVRALIITSDLTLTAQFDTIWYTATATANNITMGHVEARSGRYYHGENFHAVAITDDSTLYRFLGWSHGSTQSAIDTIVKSDIALTAQFGITGFSLTLHSADTAMGTVSGSGAYIPHQLVTITATPARGHSFLMWSDGNTSATRQIYITSDSTLTAYFSINRYTVSVSINDSSLGFVSGAGVYLYGETVTLTAHPAPHYRIANFNGTPAASNTFTFILQSDTTITADFARDFIKIYTRSDHGTLAITAGNTPANTNYQPTLVYYNDSVVITNSPDHGYHFTDYTRYSITYDTIVDTVYVIDSLVVDSIYITPEGEVITLYDTIAHYEPRTTLNVNYSALDTLTTDTLSFRSLTDLYIETHYARNSYTVSLSGLHATLTGDSIYLFGDLVTLTAHCDSHYHFVAWLDTLGDTISTLNPFSFAIDSNVSLIAATALDQLTLTLTATTGGTATGAGLFDYGSTATITATADDGYYFIAWSDGDTHAIRQITLTTDTSLTAIFYLLGINQTDRDDLRIHAEGLTIHIEGAEGQHVTLFDAVGRQVATIAEAKPSLKLQVTAAGIYLVKIGKHPAQRIMVVR